MKTNNIVSLIIKIALLYLMGFFVFFVLTALFANTSKVFTDQLFYYKAAILLSLSYELIRMIIVVLFVFLFSKILNVLPKRKIYSTYFINGIIVIALMCVYNYNFHVFGIISIRYFETLLQTSRSFLYIGVIQVALGLFNRNEFIKNTK